MELCYSWKVTNTKILLAPYSYGSTSLTAKPGNKIRELLKASPAQPGNQKTPANFIHKIT